MSILDRLRQTETETVQEDSPHIVSSTLARADSPVIHRIRVLFNETRKRSEDFSGGKSSWILKTVMDEVIDTLAEQGNEELLVEYILLTSRIMRWAATGDIDDLPDEFKEKLALADVTGERLALPAGDAMIAHT
jgi:hypothetical protein